jgi:hypothetical protein
MFFPTSGVGQKRFRNDYRLFSLDWLILYDLTFAQGFVASPAHPFEPITEIRPNSSGQLVQWILPIARAHEW